MKRILSILLILALLCSLPVFAAAEGDYEFTFRNDIKWGMSESEILALEGISDPDSPRVSTLDSEAPDGTAVRRLNINNGVFSTHIYLLYGEKLCFAGCSVDGEVDFDQIVSEYTAEYGEESFLSSFEKARWFIYITRYEDFVVSNVGTLMNAPEFTAVAETMHYWHLSDGTEVLLGFDSLSGNYPYAFICCWNQTFKSLMETEYAAAPTTPTPTPTPTPQPVPDTVTLLFPSSDRRDETWHLGRMRSELGGYFVLLRNSCMEDKTDCDMTLVYEAIDFAILKGASAVYVPMSEEQAAVVQSWLYRERDSVPEGYAWTTDYYNLLYPNLLYFKFSETMDGRYCISLGLGGTGTLREKSIALQLGRDEAIRIVKHMPVRCDTDFEKLEYLYDYITHNVKYYHDGEGYFGHYYDDMDFVTLLYDTLVKKETVCAGYAYSFAYLCKLAGIDAQDVSVWNPEERSYHAVVIAEIDGTSYWFDPTWDAGKDNIKDGFHYFGLSDSEMRATHDCWKTVFPRDLYPSCPRGLDKTRTGYWAGNEYFLF